MRSVDCLKYLLGISLVLVWTTVPRAIAQNTQISQFAETMISQEDSAQSKPANIQNRQRTNSSASGNTAKSQKNPSADQQTLPFPTKSTGVPNPAPIAIRNRPGLVDDPILMTPTPPDQLIAPFVHAGDDGPYDLPQSIYFPKDQHFGWYGTMEVDLLKPRISSGLTSPNPLVASFANPTSLPVAPLDWVGAPRIGIGYHLKDGLGDLYIDYRLVASQGSQNLPNFDAMGNGVLHSRLNINTFDFSYINPEFLGLTDHIEDRPAFRRNLQGGLGVSVMSAFFDSIANGQQILEERISSQFAGIGPQLFFRYDQQIGHRPLFVYTRVGAAGVIGAIQQRFTQTEIQNGQGVVGNYNTGLLSTGIGRGSLEAGLSWIPTELPIPLKFTMGYRFERWWNFASTNDSFGELTLQGIFCRAEWRY